jgi:alpha,alpha-trehalose phosphorylase
MSESTEVREVPDVPVSGMPLPEQAVGASADDDPTRTFEVDPWTVRESRLHLRQLARTESVFALSNGHLGVRGNLEEGEPHGLPGTYLNSVYESRPLPYAEAGYGYPESGQTIINVTNGKVVRLLVDDEPFDVRYGALDRHERWLDLKSGCLHRDVEWTAATNKRVRIRTTRLVSMTHRSLFAMEYEVEALDAVRIVLQSELVANEDMPASSADPRVSAVLRRPLRDVEHDNKGGWLHLQHRTKRSGIEVAVAADHEVEVTEGVTFGTESESREDWARATFTASLQPGQRLRLVKYVSYGWSSLRSTPALRDQVAAGLTGARRTGWAGLVEAQTQFMSEFWDGADVQVEGDPAMQQAVRFALFHVLQASVRAEGRPIAAKGLTGPGYDGHSFWDSETFVLPVLIHTWPAAAADALRWRRSTMEFAKSRARTLGLAGATFPWRTINGEECSAYWPAGVAAFHVNADIADAVIRYHDATHDKDFAEQVGLELLVETARLWASLGQVDRNGQFRIDGITGPDEYSAVADNNVYTNLMAQRNLWAACDACELNPERAAELGVTADETADWRQRADSVYLPYDKALEVHQQNEGFTLFERWDFESTPAEKYPLLLHYPYFQLYRKQVVKQADLVLAMQLRPDAFTFDEKCRNFAYYDALTVRDSSLSACTQAVMAAEVGNLDLAYAYAGEAALMDLHDLAHNTRDGLHIASLAGAWTALVSGFGGFRDHDGLLLFAPRLPAGLTLLSFHIRHRGQRLGVSTDGRTATYLLTDHGSQLRLRHHGEEVVVTSGVPVTLDIPPAPEPLEVEQPPGRAPRYRGSA